MVATANTNALV
jgi:hypothetical protein